MDAREELLVSISCITFNHKNFIRQALDGFIMQKTNFKFEVLIHDDASTDGTTEIIKEYEEKYPDIIKPMYEEENQWVKGRRGSVVFNFPRAKGKYIALCEGDDYWTDVKKLQKQVDFLEQNEDFALCFHGVQQQFEGENTEVAYLNSVLTGEYEIDNIWDDWTVSTMSMMFRTSVINSPYYIKIASDRKMLQQDMFIVISALDYGKMYGMEEEMAVYRKHEGSVTSDGSAPPTTRMQPMLSYIRLISKVYSGKYKQQSREYYTFKAFRYAYVCKERKLYFRSINFLLKAFFNHPKHFWTLFRKER